MTNEQLKSICFGALHFKETEGGYPQAFHTDSQMAYFLDNLHPNCPGMELYGRNLVDFIRKVGF
ncbi:MAG: hypothetical protein IJX84_04220 [Clostridia bacterium]|nr:hypothetical protein [Clostridia bacterium]